VGIFFNTPFEAAKQVKNVYSSIENWWFSKQIQESRLAFVEHFALTRSDSEKIFAKKLLEEIT